MDPYLKINVFEYLGKNLQFARKELQAINQKRTHSKMQRLQFGVITFNFKGGCSSSKMHQRGKSTEAV